MVRTIITQLATDLANLAQDHAGKGKRILAREVTPAEHGVNFSDFRVVRPDGRVLTVTVTEEA